MKYASNFVVPQTRRSGTARRIRRIAVGLAAVACAVSLLASRATAQSRWYELYDDALNAYQRGQWTVAEQRLTAALKDNPRQGRRQLFYGTRREDYLPEYYLGLVYLKLGRAKEAADMFAKVQREGLVTSRDREFTELARSEQDARRLLAAPPPEPQRSARGDSAPPPPLPSPKVERTPTPQASTQETQTPPRPTAADQALSQINVLIANRQFQQARSAVNAARSIVAGAELDVSVRSIDAGEAQQNLEAAISRRNWAEAQQQLGRLTSLEPKNPRLATYRNSIDAGVALGAASAMERNALRAFYGGNYAQALSILDAAVVRQNPTPRRLFYLACANAALGLLEGASGQARIARARAVFAEARGGDPVFTEDRRYISPRVLEVLQKPIR